MSVIPFSPKPSILYLEDMHALIEEKKKRRQHLNIFVLSSDGYKEKNRDSELSIFFKLLAKNVNNPRIPTRFQLAIENQGHWFSVDGYIKNNQVYLLIIDAAVLYRSTEIVKKAALNLKPIIFSYTGTQIQCDFEHCAFFTLDHLFRLSNRDQHWDDLIEFNLFESQTIIYFNQESCPKSLAFIFKNMQSFKGFNKLPDSLKTTVINKKDQTLEQYIHKNSYSENFFSMENKLINTGILLKEKKYRQRGAYFFTLDRSISNRQGFDAIGGKLGTLINKIINHNGNNFFSFFTEENESIIKNNMREILDIVIFYELKNFLIFLIQTNFLYKGCIKIYDICHFINKDFDMFKAIFKYVNSLLTYEDILAISDQISLYGSAQFKERFSFEFLEELHSCAYGSA